MADFAEDYIDEDLPESKLDEETAPKAANGTDDKNQKKSQTNFSDDRFTKLFQPRNKVQNNPFLPKYNSKPKPTLPSFIKGTPPPVRVTPSTPSPSQNQRFNQRASTTSRTTTTRTPTRGSNANNLSNRRNQLNNNNSNNRGLQSTPRPTQSTTDSSARRRFGGASNRRFNTNSTIPATSSRPRRN